MAAISKNKYDVYLWIKDKVIPSCNNIQQLTTCEDLINNFKKKYNDSELTRELMFESFAYHGIVLEKKK
jgi:hypothetical protein